MTGVADINSKCDRSPSTFYTHSAGGWTALMIAIAHGHKEVAEILLGKGADVNQRNNVGQTALILAARHRDMDIVLDLLDRGADINAKTVKGWTALMHAARHGNADVVLRLLKRGAVVNEKNVDGKTALELVQAAYPWADERITEVVRILKKAGAK